MLRFSTVIALSSANLQACGGQTTGSPTATAGASALNVAGQSATAEGGSAHVIGGQSSAGSAGITDSGGAAGEFVPAGNGGDAGEVATAGSGGHSGGAGGPGDPSGGAGGPGDPSGGAAGSSDPYGGAAGTGASAGASMGGQNGNAGNTGAPVSCSPAGLYCRDNNIYSCDPSGTELLYYPCALSGGYCIDGDWVCLEQVCKPNQPACNGSIATTCKADGSGTVPGGTNCALNNQTCDEQGRCVPQVCEANHGFCSGDTVYKCDQWGTSSYEVADCGSGKYCFTRGSRADCSKNACVPGMTGCSGENSGQCGADGNSVTNATDCSASSQVCTTNGCSASSVDTIDAAGDTGGTDAKTVIGNAFDVLSARTLTGIEIYLNMYFSRDLSWRIYELNSLTAEPNPAPQWILKYQRTSSEPAGSGFRSSGTLNFAILAGHTYAFGVQVLGDWNYYQRGQNLVQTLPFARTVSIFSANPDSNIVDAWIRDTLLYQRLTTTAP
ncbi:MAG: hypothetical protein WDO69_05165 [Pseudomonadota bacterium]